MTALIGDLFVASGEGDRLEREEADPLRVVERELDDASHLLVVDAVDDGGDRNDFDTCFVQVVDGLQLYVEQVADLAVRVGRVADAVELKVDVAETGFAAARQSSLLLANSMPLEAACTRVVTNLARSKRLRQGSRATAWARRRRTERSSAASASW